MGVGRNPGEVGPIGDGLSELKIDHGTGYRVYFMQHRGSYVLLLAGGDKASQVKDIRKAKVLALRETNWHCLSSQASA